MSSIGYPEAWAVLAGELQPVDAIRRTQEATHRLARQQSTWFRSDDRRIHWLNADSPDITAQAVSLAYALLAAAAKDRDHALHQDARNGQ